MSEKEEQNSTVELSTEKHIENLQREIKMFKENITTHEELLERLAVEEAAITKRYEIMLEPENFKILRPVWQYETLPEYLYTLKVDIENRRRNDFHQIEQNREQLNKVIGHQKEALISVQAELERLTGEENNE